MPLKSFFSLILLLIVLTSAGQTYYIVRHAEKAVTANNQAMMANDLPLSTEGEQRALALREVLKDQKIGYIFSTNTIRTKSTAAPLSNYSGIEVILYGPAPDSAFIRRLKKLKKNVLIVGHSNTVDDIVNELTGQKLLSDLADSDYDNLFVVTRRKGKYILEKKKYAPPSK